VTGDGAKPELNYFHHVNDDMTSLTRND